MLSKTDQLLAAYELVVNEPLSNHLSGQERIWFLVYDPVEQRKVDLRMGDFETATIKAEKKWASISMKNLFPLWMSHHEYKESYFKNPHRLSTQLDISFKQFAVVELLSMLSDINAEENTVIAIKDVSSLFGFARLSDILNAVVNTSKGRFLIFFPGEYESNQFRLLNARDGWSYLARPITI